MFNQLLLLTKKTTENAKNNWQPIKKPTGFLGKIVSFAMKKGNSYAYDTLLDILEIKDQDNIFEIGYGHEISIERSH